MGKETAELFLILSVLNAVSISLVQTAATTKSFLLTISILSVPFFYRKPEEKCLRGAQGGKEEAEMRGRLPFGYLSCKNSQETDFNIKDNI